MIEKKKYNLKDVATFAGVSLGTASKVINNLYVRPESRIRVERAIKELNYVPNTIARSLKSNASKTIGVVIPDIASPFVGNVLRGIEDVGGKAGYSILINDTNMSALSEEKVLAYFTEKMVDGIIYCSNTMSVKLQKAIKASGIPTSLIMTSAEEKSFSTTVMDNEAAAYEMTQYLCSCNHERILLLAGEQDDKNAGISRVEGYKKALKENHILFDESLVFYGSYNADRGYRDMKKALEQRLSFTAVFAAADVVAIGAMKALREKKLRIPDDISVAGFDGIWLSDYTAPALCTVEQPFYQFGAEGTKILIDMIEKDKKDTHLKLDWKILKRDSVKIIKKSS